MSALQTQLWLLSARDVDSFGELILCNKKNLTDNRTKILFAFQANILYTELKPATTEHF